MRRYLVYVRLAVQDAMSFRLQFWCSLGEAVLSFALSYYLWRAIYSGADELAGMRLHQMLTYLIVSALVRGALGGGSIAYIGEAFESGSFGVDLVRPLSFPLICLARSGGVSIVYLVTRGLPIFIVGVFAVGIQWPAPAAAIFFPLALVLAFLIYFLLEFVFAQLIPYLQTYYGVAQVWQLLTVFATGALIPLPFFPPWFRELLFALPFHTVFYTPINLFLGHVIQISPCAEQFVRWGCSQPGAVLLEQALWAVFLAGLSAVLWRRTSYRLVMQGG